MNNITNGIALSSVTLIFKTISETPFTVCSLDLLDTIVADIVITKANAAISEAKGLRAFNILIMYFIVSVIITPILGQTFFDC